jgi:hypothetical protein
LGWEDRYQCGVGATADIAGLTPFVSAQMFSTAVGLQQYGAGDIHKQTDTIAEQGISEVGGALTVLGSSLVQGVGNYGKAGYKVAESTVGTAGDIVDWGLENARPASIEEAVARANSGCLTHASHKAGVYLDGMGLDRQGQYKSMNGLGFDQDANRDLFGNLRRGVGGNTQQESAELNDEQKDMLLKYLMSEPSKSSNNSPQ